MSKIWKRATATVLMAALIAVVGCVTNPVTGKKEVILISENQEIEMGKSTDQSIRQQFGFYQDPEMNAYVDRVARKIVPYTHRTNLPYQFAVLDTPIENAFAAPGGYIYITRGLLAMMNSEAELAAVLGHELGHVNARHSVREMSKQLLILGGILIGSALSEDIQKIAPLLVVGMQVLFLKFSRDDEYQADSLGVLYSRKAGYSPTQMVPFFQSLLKLEESAGGGVRPPNFLSTHPLTTRRIEEVKKMLVPIDAEMDVIRDGYLRRVDGLTYGEDPRQGFVEGNAFYCPDLAFAFAFPEGWVVQNTPQQVVVAPKDEKAAVILTAEKTNKDLTVYQKEQIQRFSDVQISEIRSGGRRINGLNAFRGSYYISPKPAEGQGVDESKTNAVDVECIRKDDFVFTFLSLTSKGDYPNYQGAVDRTVQSFQRLTDPKALAVRPTKLRIATVPRATTMRAFLQENNVPDKRWKTLTFLNSVELDGPLAQGQLVKIY